MVRHQLIPVEELAALGVRLIVGFGVAGALVDALPKGTQIRSRNGWHQPRAYHSRRGDGRRGTCATLVATATRLGISLARVKIVTVDAVYRETPADVQRWVSLGRRRSTRGDTAVCGGLRVRRTRSVARSHKRHTFRDDTSLGFRGCAPRR
jgi:uridine phosphorylase